ncbi:MAG: hypothetical protein CR981_04195 [Proteobacteria bacterium]|nr:MAG: hypothetical protein CR981_04195 [Pseudomonadota bacterium]PIE65417.1 MAG: hypothetical protein CSA26_03595 [Desulfobacterales bacterium]
MKKVIAAAAGLMLVGTMVGSASGAVSLSGDARARWFYSQYGDGTKATEQNEGFSSRVRVNFNAEAKGGAYAKTRLRMADTKWDGTRKTRAKGEGSNLFADYAYIGIPMGPVTLEAGLMTADVTPFLLWDVKADMFKIKYERDMTSLEFWFAKDMEYTFVAPVPVQGQVAPVVVNTDFTDDNDINTYAVLLNQKFSGDFGVTVAALYVDDQTPSDAGGLAGTVQIGGPIGPVELEAAGAYKEAVLQGTEDDGMGFYLSVGYDMGAASVTVMGGMTMDGYVADDDFGFMMIGSASSITPDVSAEIGAGGDTTFFGGIFGFDVSEDLSLEGVLAYADVDEMGSAFEVSGSAKYVISDGANVKWDIGYLGLDYDHGDPENPFATTVTFNVSF